MSAPTFSVLFVVGAAALAFWIVQRTSRRAPGSFLMVVAHLVAANVLSVLVLPETVPAMQAVGEVPALMLVALPAIVYFFVAAGWLLLFLQRLLGLAR